MIQTEFWNSKGWWW